MQKFDKCNSVANVDKETYIKRIENLFSYQKKCFKELL